MSDNSSTDSEGTSWRQYAREVTSDDAPGVKLSDGRPACRKPHMQRVNHR